MRKIVICCLASVVMLGAAGVLYCAGKEAANIKTIDGEVVLVDSGQSVLTVKWFKNPGDEERREKTFLISKDTNITKDAAPIGLADVRAGDVVIIEYEENPERIVVKSITVKELPTEEDDTL